MIRRIHKGPRQDSQPIPFGERVKRRRTAKTEKILKEEDGVSKSRARKLVKSEEKTYKNPRWPFERKSGRLYEELLRAIKQDKNEGQAKATAILDNYFDNEAESPICQAWKSWQNDVQNNDLKTLYVQEICRQSVSRSLQMCFQTGVSELRSKVVSYTLPVFGDIAMTPAGYHLCVKMLRYSSSDKSLYAQMKEALVNHYKSFWSKYGAKVWEHLANESNKVMNEMVLRLFFARMYETELKDFWSEDPVVSYMKCSDVLKKTVRERCKELVDKLVLKELLGCAISQRFLKHTLQILKIEEIPETMTQLSNSVFEANRVLLKYKDGVYVLVALMGYWTAKQRRDMIEDEEKNMTLDQLNWTDYLLNQIDSVFVGRLLCTVDDTKRSGAVLAAIFGMKVHKKNGNVQVTEQTEATWKRLLNKDVAHKSLGVIGAVLYPELASKFVNSYCLDQLSMASPTTFKDPELRASELRDIWLRIVNMACESLPDFKELVESAELKPLLKEKLFEHIEAAESE